MSLSTSQKLKVELRGHTALITIDNPGANPWIDRLIAILAVTAGLLIVGSYLEELLWAILAFAACSLSFESTS